MILNRIKFYYLNFLYKNRYQNPLVRHIYKKMNNLKLTLVVKVQVIKMFENYWLKISELLYEKLTDQDKDLFIRFLLKRFSGVETVYADEKTRIDEAFEKIQDICEIIGDEKWYHFDFRGEMINFFVPIRNYDNQSYIETRLMKHYEVVHAFDLIEYEKDGFNPENGMTILDCGAADGDTAVFFSKLYPDSVIYSFEFMEVQFEYINKNIENNDCTNVHLVKGFLYETSGQYFLSNDFEVLTINNNREDLRIINTISIDDFVKKNDVSKIGLIKMDLEGGEMGALKGAIHTIKDQKPLLYIPIYHLKSDLYTIPEFLNQLNMPMEISLKWTEKLVWGVDCVLFVRFL